MSAKLALADKAFILVSGGLSTVIFAGLFVTEAAKLPSFGAIFQVPSAALCLGIISLGCAVTLYVLHRRGWF